MKNWVRTVLLVVSLAAIGCESDDDGGGGNAPAKCQLLTDHFCTRVANCTTGSDVFRQCQVVWSADLDCSKAVAVGLSFDQCVAQVDALACNQLTALPTSCAGVIGVKE